ncbi:MAG: hypothetical protein OER95_07940 [Acidimicrobiia bacterium]|nr:hypothetical protein [Acidimicrobiia bacterium]
MAVDTYLKGKNTSKYRKVRQDDVEVLVAPTIVRLAQEVHVVARKGLFGRKLVAVIYRDPNQCVI